VHSISDVGTLECPDAIVLENNEPSRGRQEISINYIDSGESYDRKTTIVDIYFAEIITEIIQSDLDPKTMAVQKALRLEQMERSNSSREPRSQKERYSH